MKRTLQVLAILILAATVWGTSAFAVDFTVTANIPAATGVSIIATRNQMVNGTEEFGPEVTEFDFDPMSLDTKFGIYRSPHFFAIDVGATGGAEAPDVVVSFNNESNPTGQAKGLGSKATTTFTLVSGGPTPTDQSEAIIASLGTKLLSQLIGGQTIDETLQAGGFLRMRVGIYDGGSASLNAAGGGPFTNSDKPGKYTGTFTVTATID